MVIAELGRRRRPCRNGSGKRPGSRPPPRTRAPARPVGSTEEGERLWEEAGKGEKRKGEEEERQEEEEKEEEKEVMGGQGDAEEQEAEEERECALLGSPL